MDFQEEFLKKTINAINELIKNGVYIVNVRRIRRINKTKSSNRSDINFYWRSLEILEEKGFLKLFEGSKPKKYEILSIEKIEYSKGIFKVIN